MGSKKLTDQHKVNKITSLWEFLKHFELEGKQFTDSIGTGDKKWVTHYIKNKKRMIPSQKKKKKINNHNHFLGKN